MIPYFVALVSEVEDLEFREVAKVAAALQKQVIRDFGPVWEITAAVSAFAKLEDVPIGYWPIIVQEDIGFEGAAGIHLDEGGQPFALVQLSEAWSLTASHEALEMLADPFGNRLVAGDSIKPGQGRVEYLVEVCDPSEDAKFGYTSNGVLVSDFYTPRYFDPADNPGVQYSFSGAITKPRQVLRGGYLSWHEPVGNHWFQAQFFTSKLKIVDLGVFDTAARSLRSEIDRRTFEATAGRVFGAAKKGGKPTRAAALRGGALTAAHGAGAKAVSKATGSKADSWRRQITALRADAKAKLDNK